ncbi:MAG TPA: 30S ribosomal protein S2 [Rhodospirillaceae bacterium]|jgi:small subunit ribosomal protein S2|nr:30S ribosomal protein S2 [Alphaproteobacteria bacterium]HBH27075.1 30S ribosomal protein S2 [Rhodospirillaceae bacterium]
MRALLEAGVHFGHRASRWNPRMRPYIFGVRAGVHIIDLGQTAPALQNALQTVQETVAGGGRVLFVGTKRQARGPIAAAAQRCGQHYVNQRWLGGMLTNWKTVSKSVDRLKEVEALLDPANEQGQLLTKKERLGLAREQAKLTASIGGIRDMGGLPDVLFVIDTNHEDIAVKEAAKARIPVIAIVDSNASLEGVTHVIPGNDDALRAIDLYCTAFADAALSGLQRELGRSAKDPGEAQEVPEALNPPVAEGEPKKEEENPA